MLRRPIGIIFLVYLIIGVIVAWSRGYLHLSHSIANYRAIRRYHFEL